MASRIQETSIINYQISKVRKETNLKTYSESAFNEAFDQKLQYLVLLYRFNFQAIALHLAYEFPQYQYKLNKKSVQYRWFQLHLQEKQKQRKFMKEQIDLQKKEDHCLEKENAKSWYYYDEQEKNSPEKLQTALKAAQNLDDAETQGFILYKPRFSTENQYSLEREQFKKEKIEKIMNNSYVFDFGLFQNKQYLQDQPETNNSSSMSQKQQIKEQAFKFDEQQFEMFMPHLIPVKSDGIKLENKKVEDQYCFDVEEYDSD